MDRVAAENRGSRKTLSDKLTLTPLHRIHAHGRRQTRMPAPPVGSAAHPPTGDAPGTYVLKNRRIGPKRWKSGFSRLSSYLYQARSQARYIRK